MLSKLQRCLPLFILVLVASLVVMPATAGAHKGQGKKHAKKHRKYNNARNQALSRTRTQLTVLTTSPAGGATISGSVNWGAEVLGGTATKVAFAVDGSTLATDTTAPYAYGLDTKKLVNGGHTLTATAYGKQGVNARSSVTVTVYNAPSTPEPTPAPEPTPEPTPELEPTPEPAPTPKPSGPIYWGAWIGNQLTGQEAPWDMNAVAKFESSVGKSLSMVQFSAPFANCYSSPCKFYGLPTGSLEDVRKTGAIPFFSWASQALPSSTNQPNFQLADVISGSYDSYIRSFATSAKNWGHPFFLRFNWEQNGNWFPWAEGVNGNRSGEYVAAWRHVHDIFSSLGASNVSWVWCPNIDPDNRWQSLRSTYPGDGYVDWTCLDGYNQGTMPSAPDRWRTFDQLFSSTYKQIVTEIAPSKPMVIGEVGSTEYGGSKAQWIREMLGQLPSEYPSVRGLLWFDKYAGGDWPLDSSGSATQAFAEGIGSPAYTTDTFSSLSTSTILPAS
ncbi:MAG TPA: Ig-like domain-containing protein [Solirubrobacterales bacterium]|nr:Ig-like domain-containing protein [Solirubrobacterales bacterium]